MHRFRSDLAARGSVRSISKTTSANLNLLPKSCPSASGQKEPVVDLYPIRRRRRSTLVRREYPDAETRHFVAFAKAGRKPQGLFLAGSGLAMAELIFTFSA